MKGPWTEKVEKWWADFSPNIKIVWETIWSWLWGHWVETLVAVFVAFAIWGVLSEFQRDPWGFLTGGEEARKRRQQLGQTWREIRKNMWRWKDPNVNGNTETAQEDRDTSEELTHPLSEKVEKKVKQIIIEQVGVEESQVTPDASFIEDLGADSLDAVELVMVVEEEFGIEIPDEDAERIVRVKDAVQYIHDRIERGDAFEIELEETKRVTDETVE